MFTCTNPGCKITREDEPDKCWNCGADRYGRISEKRGKRVSQTRELLRELDNEKFKCVHNIRKWYPCEKCAREDEVLGSYRTSALKHIEEVLMEHHLVATRAEAVLAAKLVIDQVDLQK